MNKRNFYIRLLKQGIMSLALIMLSFNLGFAQVEDLEKTEKIKVEKSNEFVYQANELLDEDKFIPAEKKYREAISKNNSNVAGNYNLGNSYYKKGNYDEALFRHLEAVKIADSKKEKHRAYHNIGNVLMKKEECKEAAEAYKNALRNDPTDDETRYNYVLAKECAEQQEDQKNDENDKDKDKEEEKKDEDKKDGENDDKDKNEDKDKGDKNDEEGDDKDQKPNENKDDKKDGKDKNEKPEQPKPKPGELSPQQIKSLLEAMNNQEQKVQEKLNAEKRKGAKVETEKDW